jgi:putative flippase GtrA
MSLKLKNQQGIFSLKTRFSSVLPPELSFKLEYLINTHLNFIKYIFIGVLGFVVDFSLYCFLIRFANLHYQLANVIGAVSGMTHNFTLNYFFNFRITGSFLKRLLAYYLIGILGMGISYIGLYLCIDIFHFSKYLSKPVIIFIVAISLFLLNKKSTFRNDI